MDNSEKKSAPPRRKFISRLEKFRFRLLLHHTLSALARSLLFIPFLAAATLAAARCGVPPRLAAILLACIIFAALWLLKAPWRLERCAKLADLDHDGKDPVVSALEVYRKDPAGAFYSYIYARGELAVPDRPSRRAFSPLPWKSAAGAFLAALALLLIPVGFSSANGGSENKDVKANAPGAVSPISTENKDDPRRRVAEESSAVTKKGDKSAKKSAARSRHDAEMSSLGGSGDPDPAEASSAGASGDDADGEMRKDANSAAASDADAAGTGEKADRNADDETASGKSQRSERNHTPKHADASNAGTAEAGEDADRDADAGAAVGDSQRPGNRRSRKRSAAKRPAETPAEDSSLLGLESQSGQEQDGAGKEGKDGQPGDSPGGESGAKKARGAGSALPVIPLPDSVAGRPGNGSDAVTPGSTRGPADAVYDEMSGQNPGVRAAEPPVTHPGFTSLLRRRIRSDSMTMSK